MKRIFATTAVLFAFAGVASAQTATTDPVGFVSVTVPAQSDAVLAVPLNRSAAFKGKIQTISSNVITVAGTPAWTANQFVQAIPTQNDTFAIQIATGTKEGLIAKVTANGTNTLTVQFDAGDDLTGVKSVDVDGVLNADEIDVLPYWTPASLISAVPTTGTQLLFFPSSVAGTNLAAGTIYVFNGTEWRQGATPVGNVPLGFGQAFIVRNNGGVPQTLSLVGSVPMAKHRTKIYTLAASSATNQQQDNWIGYVSPVPETIGDLGLGFNAGDQMLVFDNASTGKNKAAAIVLVWTGVDWKQGATVVTNTFQLQPGFGYVYRKKGTGTPQTVVWEDLQAYLQ